MTATTPVGASPAASPPAATPPAAAATGLTRRLDAALLARLVAGVTATGEPTTVTAPFTGEPLVSLPQSTADDVQAAYASARAAQASWAATPVRDRSTVLALLHDLVLRRRDEALDILQWETGKARGHAFEEVLEVAACAQHFSRRAPRLLAPRRRPGAFPVLTRAVESRRPKGVVCVITPWNYPLALSDDVLPALVAGNAVVQKPDTQTALSALWLRELAIEAGLPSALWQVVLGDRDTIGDPLIDGADFVAFTGSTTAGRTIAARAGQRLIGCSLELGGKNPMVVLADADVDKAARGAIRACFNNAGQLCVSIERIYVDRSVHDAFVRAFVGAVGRLRLGATLDRTTDVGSLTYQRQLDAVRAHVDDAVSRGATVLAGGRQRPDLGPLFYEPTVLTDVTPDMSLYRDETFGPVVAIYPVDGDEAAVAAANDTEYGLNACVWSRDTGHARAVAARIDAGTVNINEGYASAYGSQGAPMGGMKASGLGRRHGDEGLLKLTEPQTVASQHLLGFDPPAFLGPDRYATVLTHTLTALKRLHIR
ncbi:succinic semialdehyde dehydrogenase [Pseudofrankia asymbiotica]|uniref:Succinic semialdehyde dehydrogenase n=1 Tax=Pseudofrankia asymbiotica TaxID=1834516 RepID=A0A1V2I9Z7_9ACTN|nr:succinic semialdehyde dehydrogenase [Pseudofrankia asymbiotica]ONH29744.1 succinic semialdehyde dehydrogenase [Pseudofrankia asymbiotica]